MGQKLFTSGEFAKFCNTTKDTLFHYDDINLLKPAKIAPNGYRYYSANQAFLFDMISSLKEVGLSLEEIKIYMDNRDAKTFLSMLKEKDKKIHQEIERLKRLRSLLKNTMNITLDSFNVEIDKITFTHKEEEYFIVTEGPKTPDDKAVFSAISQHVNYCNKHNFYYTFSLGEIISAEHIQDKTFQTTYFCTKINRKVNNKQLLIKPAGLYAIKYIRGSYDDLIKAYAQFVEELHNMNYKVIGALYEEDILNYLSETDFNYYLMRIEARIL